MQETVEQYKERLRRYTVGQDPLALQAAMPGKLEDAVKAADAIRLGRQPAPGKWSIKEIVAHLADTELVGGYRIRLILSAPGSPIQAFDQDKWAGTGRYEQRDLRDSLEFFRVLRGANLNLLSALSSDEWYRHGVHAERGVESIRDIARLYAGHDLNHLEQITAILASACETG